MELDVRIVQELRQLARNGVPSSQILQHLEHRLEQDFSRLLAVAYFRKAFFLSLRDAVTVGASGIFPDGGWTAADFNSEMTRVMHSTRHSWEDEAPA
jgi:hypothetical protein